MIRAPKAFWERVKDIAREKKMAYIDLSSNHTRTDAHRLYEKGGFTERDSKFFRLNLTWEK